MVRAFFRARGGECLFLSVAAAIVAWLILVPPVLGLANNGDFGKLIANWDLGAPAEAEYKYAITTYTFSSSHRFVTPMWSSEALLIVPALALNLPFAPAGKFDIRAVGLVHAGLLLAALWLALPLFRLAQGWRRFVLMCAALVLFCDVLYVSAFNSFYMDTSAYLFSLLAVVLGLRAKWNAAVLCAVLVATSKLPHIPAGILLGAGVAMAIPGWKPRLWAIAALVASAAGFLVVGAPPEYSSEPLYDAIFPVLIAHSPAPERDLAELGLDPSWRQYAGHHAFEEGTPMGNRALRSVFERSTSYSRLAFFYLKHPGRALDTYVSLLDRPELTRSELIGNYDPSAGRPAYARSYAFSVSSSMKTILFGGRPLLYLTFVLAVSALWLPLSRAWPASVRFIGAAVALAALAELAIFTLAESADVIRHLCVHQALMDMVVFGVLAAAITARRRQSV